MVDGSMINITREFIPLFNTETGERIYTGQKCELPMAIELSDAQIEHILDKADSAWRHNKLAKGRKKEFLTSLKSYLTDSGTKQDVCHHCLGSGFNVEGRREMKMSLASALDRQKIKDTAQVSDEQLYEWAEQNAKSGGAIWGHPICHCPCHVHENDLPCTCGCSLKGMMYIVGGILSPSAYAMAVVNHRNINKPKI